MALVAWVRLDGELGLVRTVGMSGNASPEPRSRLREPIAEQRPHPKWGVVAIAVFAVLLLLASGLTLVLDFRGLGGNVSGMDPALVEAQQARCESVPTEIAHALHDGLRLGEAILVPLHGHTVEVTGLSTVGAVRIPESDTEWVVSASIHGSDLMTMGHQWSTASWIVTGSLDNPESIKALGDTAGSSVAFLSPMALRFRTTYLKQQTPPTGAP